MLDFLIAVKRLRDKLEPSQKTVAEVLGDIGEDIDTLVASASQFAGQDRHYLVDLAYIIDKLDVIALAAEANGAVKPEPATISIPTLTPVPSPTPVAPVNVSPPASVTAAPVVPPATTAVTPPVTNVVPVPAPVAPPVAVVAPQAAPVAPVVAPAAK